MQHQVLAVPSLYEAFGIAYLEAMGFGLPVIASSAGGAHELITQESMAFSLPLEMQPPWRSISNTAARS